MLPFIFILIIVGSVALLVPHWQLMRRLGKVDTAFYPLEDAMRKRLDSILDGLEDAPEDDALKQLCETARDAETEELLKSHRRIEKMLKERKWEPSSDDAEDSDEFNRLKEEYFKAIGPYNEMIKKFPWKIYAGILPGSVIDRNV